jgi:hypothetical protein
MHLPPLSEGRRELDDREIEEVERKGEADSDISDRDTGQIYRR